MSAGVKIETRAETPEAAFSIFHIKRDTSAGTILGRHRVHHASSSRSAYTAMELPVAADFHRAVEDQSAEAPC
jgi:hypothetical protein